MEEVIDLKKEIFSLKEKLDHSEEEVRRLKHILQLFKKQKFGSKSEKYEEEVSQLLFNEFEVEASSAPQLPLEQEVITYTRSKGKGKKKPFPSTLEREEVIIDISEEEKICPHDVTLLKQIGEDIVEKLVTRPAISKIRVEIKKKYACPCCSSYLIQGKTNPILPKTIATPELLSYICFSKFFQGLSLYRLEELYKFQGIELNRGTMARWMVQVSEKLIPLWNLLEEKMLATKYVNIDATHVQVLKEENRKPETKSFMWVRGSPQLNVVLFNYDIPGGGKVAKDLMLDYQGALQGDAHRGYGAMDKQSITLLGCMMHARRRFYNAWIKSGKKKQSLAEIGLKMIKKLYSLEEAYKQQALSPSERYLARKKETQPYLEKIKLWCEKKKSKVLKGSDIGNAIHYFVNEYEELSGFLKDGCYEIDNGWVERQIKSFAIGRKNWLFADTVHGANASAVLYSLILTAKLNGKDPFEVMLKVFNKIPDCQKIEDYEELVEMFLIRSSLG